MIPKEYSEEFYSRFHQQLKNSQEWPGPFLFKFIVRGDIQKVSKLIFEGKGAQLKLKNSSKNTFVSVSFLVKMKNPDEIIAIYKAASSIEGIITL